MAQDHWFEDVAEHLGEAYLRYSFTRGTEQEVGFLCEALALAEGDRVLDVGCGPGRHAHALARRGIEVVGVDISQRFVDLAAADAPPGARFVRLDARSLSPATVAGALGDAHAPPLGDAGTFDAAISLCQGAFGLLGHPGPGPRADAPPVRGPVDPDGEVLSAMAGCVIPGGRVAVSAFSADFQVRFLEPERDAFDADRGVNHERTEIRDPSGRAVETDLWTSCFTPRELRLLADRAGLEVDAVFSVTPGAYRADPPDLDHPEHLLVATRR